MGDEAKGILGDVDGLPKLVLRLSQSCDRNPGKHCGCMAKTTGFLSARNMLLTNSRSSTLLRILDRIRKMKPNQLSDEQIEQLRQFLFRVHHELPSSDQVSRIAQAIERQAEVAPPAKPVSPHWPANKLG